MRLAAVLLLLSAASAHADCPNHCDILGGGPGRTDCFVGFDGIVPNMPASRPTYLRCTDGDPSCDVDGTADGACTVMVSVCINNFDGRVPTCLPRKQHTFDIQGAVPSQPGYDPQRHAIVEAMSDVFLPTERAECSTPLPWTIELRERNGVRLTTKETLHAWGYGEIFGQRSVKDKDRVRVVCVPAAP